MLQDAINACNTDDQTIEEFILIGAEKESNYHMAGKAKGYGEVHHKVVDHAQISIKRPTCDTEYTPSEEQSNKNRLRINLR